MDGVGENVFTFKGISMITQHVDTVNEILQFELYFMELHHQHTSEIRLITSLMHYPSKLNRGSGYAYSRHSS